MINPLNRVKTNWDSYGPNSNKISIKLFLYDQLGPRNAENQKKIQVLINFEFL